MARYILIRSAQGMILAAALTSTGARAYGQTAVEAPTAQTRAIAQKLFERALEGMAKSDYGTACPQLEEVVRLVPDTLGAKLKLAECYEKSGRFASAWATYSQAAATANSSGQTDREAVANEGVARVAPRLSYLQIEVPANIRALDHLEIRRDGELVTAPQWGLALPLDAGKHVVVATARGMKTWRQEVNVRADGTARTVVVGDLRTVDFVPDPKALLIEFRSPAADETWVLQQANGKDICRLPCTRWVVPGDGTVVSQRVRRRTKRFTSKHEMPIPANVEVPESRRLVVTPRPGTDSIAGGLTLMTVGAVLGISTLAIEEARSGDDASKATLVGVGGAAAVVGLVLVVVDSDDELMVHAPGSNGAKSAEDRVLEVLVGPGALGLSASF